MTPARVRLVAAAVKEYLADAARRKVQASTLKSYRFTLNLLVKVHGKLPREQLTIESLRTYQEARKIKPPMAEDVATLPFAQEEVHHRLLACDAMRGMWEEDTTSVRRRARALVLTLLYSGLRMSDVGKLKRSALALLPDLYVQEPFGKGDNKK